MVGEEQDLINAYCSVIVYTLLSSCGVLTMFADRPCRAAPMWTVTIPEKHPRVDKAQCTRTLNENDHTKTPTNNQTDNQTSKHTGKTSTHEPMSRNTHTHTHLTVAQLEKKREQLVTAARLRAAVSVDERVDHHPRLDVRFLQHELIPYPEEKETAEILSYHHPPSLIAHVSLLVSTTMTMTRGGAE